MKRDIQRASISQRPRHICHKVLRTLENPRVCSDSVASLFYNFLCCNSSRPFRGVGYTKIFTCPQRKKSRRFESGDFAGLDSGPSLPTNSSVKVPCTYMHSNGNGLIKRPNLVTRRPKYPSTEEISEKNA